MALIPRYLSTARGGLSAAAATLLLGAGLAPAAAQEAPTIDLTSPFARELQSCVSIEDDAERLACFDRTAAPLEQARQEAEEAAVKVLQGEGDWDSEVYTMDGPWHIAWTLEGSILTIELRDRDDQRRHVVGNQIGAGEGASQKLEPGTWQLAIRAVGPWRVRVVRGSPD